jgi:hypothetical protein
MSFVLTTPCSSATGDDEECTLPDEHVTFYDKSYVSQYMSHVTAGGEQPYSVCPQRHRVCSQLLCRGVAASLRSSSFKFFALLIVSALTR